MSTKLSKCFICGKEYKKPPIPVYDVYFAGKKRSCCSYSCRNVIEKKKQEAKDRKIKEADLL